MDDTILDGGYDAVMPGEGANSRRLVGHKCRGLLLAKLFSEHLDLLESPHALDCADDPNVVTAAQDGRVSCYACEKGHVWGRAYLAKSRLPGRGYVASAPISES